MQLLKIITLQELRHRNARTRIVTKHHNTINTIGFVTKGVQLERAFQTFSNARSLSLGVRRFERARRVSNSIHEESLIDSESDSGAGESEKVMVSSGRLGNRQR